MNLERFKRAQAQESNGFAAAMRELREGRKRGHWIWYIFPQLAGLGQSSMSTLYGLEGVAEATAYLRDAELRTRLVTATGVVADALRHVPPPALADLMGSEIDALKLISSITLFRGVAERLSQDDQSLHQEFVANANFILTVASAQGYPPCVFTERQLKSWLALEDPSEPN